MLLMVPLTLAAGCSTAGPTDAVAASSSTAAALSSAAQASPGAYGQPVDPSLPNPTDVATDAPGSGTTGGGAVVVVTYADWDPGSEAIEASAYVPGIVESGGNCTLTATAVDGTTASSSTLAEPDAGSTTCADLTIPRLELSAGQWQVRIDYDSATTNGRSAENAVVVP